MLLTGPERGFDHPVHRVHDRAHARHRLGEPLAEAEIAGDVLGGTDPAAPTEHPHLPSGV